MKLRCFLSVSRFAISLNDVCRGKSNFIMIYFSTLQGKQLRMIDSATAMMKYQSPLLMTASVIHLMMAPSMITLTTVMMKKTKVTLVLWLTRQGLWLRRQKG